MEDIEKLIGKRCKEYQKGCFTCESWQAIDQACNQARIDELEIVRWAAVCADAPYINENDRAGFNAVKEQVTNHIDDRIKELKELNNEL